MRKTAQAALLVLLEQELVAKNDVEEQVCPLLLMLTNSDAHDDFRTEAAAVSLLPRSSFFLVVEPKRKVIDSGQRFRRRIHRERHG